MRENKEKYLEALFFADKSGWVTIDVQRERELGKIVMDARTAVEREIKDMKAMMSRGVFDDSLKKIRGACLHVLDDSADVLKVESEEIEDMVDLNDDDVDDDEGDEEKKSGKIKTVSKRWHEVLGLDDEEADLLDLLTGEREPGDADVVPDELLRREFESLKRKNYYAVEAEEELAMSVMGLGVSIAKNSKFRKGHLMDLIQEAYRGALVAARKIDINKLEDNKCRFSTYATWWIKQYVKKYGVNNIPEIRLPLHVDDFRSKVGKAKHDIINESFRSVHDQPSLSEIVKRTEMDVKAIIKVLTLPYTEKVLDAPLNHAEGGGGMHDILADTRVASPDHLVEKEMIQRFLYKLLNGLKPIQREVIEKRFGLNGNNVPQTLKEIGNGARSRERIRQIESMALNKLRFRIRSMGEGEGGVRLDDLI